MMRPFFQSAARQTALEAEAMTWVGTPFVANNASKGAGVGCVNLVHEVMVSLGAVPRLALPRYELDRGHHSMHSQLLSFLMTEPLLAGRLVMVPVNGKALPGDMLAMQSGYLDHHLAVQLLFGRVLHATDRWGVLAQNADDEIVSRRVLYRLRIMEGSR